MGELEDGMLTVSVIVPVHNAEKWLDETLASVARQVVPSGAKVNRSTASPRLNSLSVTCAGAPLRAGWLSPAWWPSWARCAARAPPSSIVCSAMLCNNVLASH